MEDFFSDVWVSIILQQTAQLFRLVLSKFMVHLIQMISSKQTAPMKVVLMSAIVNEPPKHTVNSMPTASRVDLNTFFPRKAKSLQPMQMCSQEKMKTTLYTTQTSIRQPEVKKQGIYNSRSLVMELTNL